MLSKKRSRKINIDNEIYRWSIAPDGQWVTLVVQDENSNGQRLEIIIDTDINRMWIEFPNTDNLNLRVIKPALVAELIRKAIKIGWKPKYSGSPLELTLDDKDELIIRRGLL
ncbi:MAG: hypothetical protein GY749_13065 [Desulfobacteraceae bacterium]|nr:hypothetical protein [Desulfobacteraceae bacterium]MCP4347089.1 hypothetical protein [Desulfobacterales bacterium]